MGAAPFLRRPIPGAAAVAAMILAATACGSGDTGSAGPGSDEGSITVFAAASLRASFTELAGRFEEAHPGSDVALNFAGSSDLATQLSEGAPADVFASADTRTMARLADVGLLAGEPTNFASNSLQLAVPPGNPAGITSLADAAEPGVRTVVCAPQVPCGAAAVTLQDAAGVDLMPVSEESSVTDVLGKVTSGEADAGLVYVTDVMAAGGAVLGIDVPGSADALTTYPIAALSRDGGTGEATARAFVEFVRGPEGQAVLGAAGFGAP